MAEPVPAPTPTQIETVVDITMLSTATVTTMLSAYEQDIANAKWAATLLDIAAWPDIRDEAGDIKKVGSIEFFEGVAGMTRLDFRNRVRRRYGQLTLSSESGNTVTTCGYVTAAVSVGADW